MDEERIGKMKKKLIAMMTCLAMTVSLLAGCGGSGEDSSSAETTQESSQETEDSEQEDTDSSSSDTITVTDHADRQVELPAQIDRVVVADIYPMASVLTVFLGSAEKLVGIDPVCMSAAQSGILGELFPEILDADTSLCRVAI